MSDLRRLDTTVRISSLRELTSFLLDLSDDLCCLFALWVTQQCQKYLDQWQRVHVNDVSQANTSENWIEGVTFMVHFFPIYWQENASSTTVSELITGVVSQFLVAYASSLWVQAQLGKMWARGKEGVHDISSCHVIQTRDKFLARNGGTRKFLAKCVYLTGRHLSTHIYPFFTVKLLSALLIHSDIFEG